MFSQKIHLMNPDIWIECRDLKNSSQIYRIMKQHNVTHYAYVICYKTNVYSYEIFKIGQSAPSGTRKNIKEMGERISRQLGHLPGWKKKQSSSHGYDLMLAIQRCIEEKKLPQFSIDQINKIEWAVGIWNLNNYTCVSMANNETQAEWAEGELANQYKEINLGKLPIGNIMDPTNNKAYKRGYVTKAKFDQFFDIV